MSAIVNAIFRRGSVENVRWTVVGVWDCSSWSEETKKRVCSFFSKENKTADLPTISAAKSFLVKLGVNSENKILASHLWMARMPKSENAKPICSSVKETLSLVTSENDDEAERDRKLSVLMQYLKGIAEARKAALDSIDV